jgi:hypothetical protein
MIKAKTNCRPDCENLYSHSPLCPVSHTAEEIEIAMFKMAFLRIKTRLANLIFLERVALSGRISEIETIVDVALGEATHLTAKHSKASAESEAAAQAEEEKHAKRTCTGCGAVNMLPDGPVNAGYLLDATVAIRSDTFSRCDSCEARLHKKGT